MKCAVHGGCEPVFITRWFPYGRQAERLGEHLHRLFRFRYLRAAAFDRAICDLECGRRQ